MNMLQVMDPVEDYLKLLRSIFDFDALKALLRKPDFTFTFDGMHGVSGPYARRIFIEVAYFPMLSKRMVMAFASTTQQYMYKYCVCKGACMGKLRCKRHVCN